MPSLSGRISLSTSRKPAVSGGGSTLYSRYSSLNKAAIPWVPAYGAILEPVLANPNLGAAIVDVATSSAFTIAAGISGARLRVTASITGVSQVYGSDVSITFANGGTLQQLEMRPECSRLYVNGTRPDGSRAVIGETGSLSTTFFQPGTISDIIFENVDFIGVQGMLLLGSSSIINKVCFINCRSSSSSFVATGSGGYLQNAVFAKCNCSGDAIIIGDKLVVIDCHFNGGARNTGVDGSWITSSHFNYGASVAHEASVSIAASSQVYIQNNDFYSNSVAGQFSFGSVGTVNVLRFTSNRVHQDSMNQTALNGTVTGANITDGDVVTSNTFDASLALIAPPTPPGDPADIGAGLGSILGSASGTSSALIFRGMSGTSVGTSVVSLNSNTMGAPISTVRAILSGHSLIDEPLGDYIQELAPSVSGCTWQHERHNVIGSPLRIRTTWGDDPSVADMVSGAYTDWEGYRRGNNTDGAVDRNMLTEMSTPSQVTGGAYTHLIICERNDQVPAIMDEHTVRHLRHYMEEFRARTGGVTYYYNVWADLDTAGQGGDPTNWIAHERSGYKFGEAICSRINESLINESRSDRISCLPVNLFLANFVELCTTTTVAGITGINDAATMDVIFADDVHLTNLGKYYIAMCVFSAIYKRSCVGLPVSVGYAGMTQTQVDSIQAIAWDQVNTYYTANVIGEQHNFSQRQTIATNHVSTYFQYRGQIPGSVTITDFQGYLTASALSNPLYSAADESTFWFEAVP